MITNFQKRIYEALKKVPKGRVITYKDLGRAVHTKAYRAVGSAMAKNPFAPFVPCHRVIRSDGVVGNYSGKGGHQAKIKMLASEGIEIKNNKVNKKYFFTFSS
jgi:methylated-DNA-[protein]-cysteine S-methyltransferase